MVMLGEYEAEEVECCPICKGEGAFMISNPDPSIKAVLSAYMCLRCGCMYLSPKMTPEAMNEYYRSGDYLRRSKYSNFMERRRALMRMLIVLQFTNITNPKRCLDVGCANGYFLKRMQDWSRDVETVGYDLFEYPDAVHEITTDKSKIEGEFDFIACIHALEHMHDPMAELEWMNSLLAYDGVMMLELPIKRYIKVEHPVTFSPDVVPIMMEHIGIENYSQLTVPDLESCIVLAKK